MANTSRGEYYKKWYTKNKQKRQAYNIEWRKTERGKQSLKLQKLRRPKRDLFMEKVTKTETCWIWDGLRYPSGYGRYGQLYAHRVSYTRFKGDIPDGLCVCHTCDNPSCVNPEHLWVGTVKDNMLDRERKGRGRYSKGVFTTSPMV